MPQAVLECAGSVLTNKYAEGYPGARYYGGCEFVDIAEQLAIDRAKALFRAEHANVQPHAGRTGEHRRLPRAAASGRHADGAFTRARRAPDARHEDQRLRAPVRNRGLRGGPAEQHDRHGRGRANRARAPPEAAARRLVGVPAGARLRALPRDPDEVGALLMVDMAHFAGLVAAGQHPNPVDFGADVVTTTLHKTLGGPRSGMILCREEHAKKIDSAVFPGQQGGPLEHIIAAKAVALRIAASEEFRERQQRTLDGAAALAEALLTPERRARTDRRHRRAPRARRPARERAQRAAGRGPPRRGRHHRQSQRRAIRPASTEGDPAACGSARRRWRRAGLLRRGLPRDRRDHRRGAGPRLRAHARGSCANASRRSPAAIRCTCRSPRRPPDALAPVAEACDAVRGA